MEKRGKPIRRRKVGLLRVFRMGTLTTI